MGYRPHLVKKYEVDYGDCISGFNYGVDEFENLLSNLKIEFNSKDGEHEIETASLLKVKEQDLEGLEEHGQEAILDLQELARTATYAKNDGYVKIHWF